MRTYRGRGRFAERPHFTDAEFERTCADALEQVGLLPATPEPVRIERFIEKRLGVTPEYVDLPDPVLGMTVFGKRGVERVLIARALDDAGTAASHRRARTTLGHEAAHGLFHAHLFALGIGVEPLFGDANTPSAPRILCKLDHLQTARPNAGYDGDWAEYQANRGMASLLLPKHLVALALAPFLRPSGSLGVQVLDDARREEAARKLAESFDVNPFAARLRIDALYPKAAEAQLAL